MAKRKRRPKKRQRTIRIKLLPRRLDVLINRFGKRFKRFAEIKKKTEKSKFGELSLTRKVLTESKMRILRKIKESAPSSIYELAKSLKRDIKSVREDVKQLSKIGFIKLKRQKIKNRRKIQRVKVKPILKIERLNVVIEFA